MSDTRRPRSKLVAGLPLLLVGGTVYLVSTYPGRGTEAAGGDDGGRARTTWRIAGLVTQGAGIASLVASRAMRRAADARTP